MIATSKSYDSKEKHLDGVINTSHHMWLSVDVNYIRKYHS